MILRPVTPVSETGPPTTNLPVGLMWKVVFSSMRRLPRTGFTMTSMSSLRAFSVIFSPVLSRISSVCWVGRRVSLCASMMGSGMSSGVSRQA